MRYHDAVKMAWSGQPVTREHLTRSRIFLRAGELCIQHDVQFPGATKWIPTAEDMVARDFTAAYFNSHDTTQPLN